MNGRGPLVVVGDALLDVDLRGSSHRSCPDAPAAPVVEDARAWYRPGGAALAAWCAARRNRPVVLVTALGRDAAGERVAELLRDSVSLVPLPLLGRTPVKTRVQADGRTVARLDDGAGRAALTTSAARLAAAFDGAAAVLVSDYGRGLTAATDVRRILAGYAASVPVVWDPHPRGSDPVGGARLVTPNAAEAGADPEDPRAALRRAGALAGRWGAESVAVTLGANGAAWADARGSGRCVGADPVPGAGDACGAGDAFAARAAGALADGCGPDEATERAVRAATEFVRAGGAASVGHGGAGHGVPLASGTDALAVAEEVRRRGGRVVAAGGCFDVLHAGHVSLLRRARSLGDCLIVCLNGDASVRALKGADRPVMDERDRAHVLSALECVDAVRVFDEDVPLDLLERLRPDVWVKGGDYTVDELPETPVVRRNGGEVVCLPALPGRSTTGLVASLRAAPG
ncbi:D-glycero-beta-D-manno-heptose 1-phosphate adenylyltransferase [Actinorugispora endophytica]|uniref:D-glycero-beta-D-manno-heptose 1-phosphate adenylyltransferase n=1 Tax=Actinorugispora endophytica TaxID=1605990 RepID=A0A4R6UYY3_9ACTN|nr:D-glycero-beta-D-manno-heptose 1-phosphate adenylyltransferase [Actinorugispora endophytica]TDQ51536.1 rfaE bifunctional protein nucleotidyltransferase chain/domain [Actinorugispora endophytica]